jgi:nucleotide-binding universal stress UspA family protein
MRESIQTNQDVVPLRVLLAVHGHEPTEWTRAICRVVSGWTNASVRVLGVVDVPSPPFTSLLPPARRFYDAARSAWRREGEPRVRAAADRLARILGPTVEVECKDSSPQGLADTIADDARGWAADVIVVAASAPMSRSWLCQGPVHERLLRLGVCAVLAVPAVSEPRPARRLVRLPRPITPVLRPAPAARRH